MRQLASVVRVDAIDSIKDADNIELARVEGWQCVVKKGEFQVGDLAVYFEIDSVLPDTDAFRWLWQPKRSFQEGDRVRVKKNGLVGYIRGAIEPLDGDHEYGIECEAGVVGPFRDDELEHFAERPGNFRIKTVKLRGCLSQGLLVPLDSAGVPASVLVGSDLTEALGVTKYEPPPTRNKGGFKRGRSAGAFPSQWLPKTDETRVQSKKRILEEMAGKPYVMTLKCDGTSGTFALIDGEFWVCSRNFRIKDDGQQSVYWDMAKKYNIEQALRDYASHRLNDGEEKGCFAIQGEIVGPNIQGNKMGLREVDLFVFNLYDSVAGGYRNDASMRDFCETYGLVPVPLIEEGESFDETLESILAKADGKYPGTKNWREGLVIRPQQETYSQVLNGRMSFKAISNKFLLAEKD